MTDVRGQGGAHVCGGIQEGSQPGIVGVGREGWEAFSPPVSSPEACSLGHGCLWGMLGFPAVRMQGDRVTWKTEAACPPLLVSRPLSVGTESRGTPAGPQSVGAQGVSRLQEGRGARPRSGGVTEGRCVSETAVSSEGALVGSPGRVLVTALWPLSWALQ